MKDVAFDELVLNPLHPRWRCREAVLTHSTPCFRAARGEKVKLVVFATLFISIDSKSKG